MDFQAMVEEFHAKHGIKKIPRLIREFKPKQFRRDIGILEHIGSELIRFSKIAGELMHHDNPLLSAIAYRDFLLLEELSEFILATVNTDLDDAAREMEALDGLADLQYIVSGTAHICDLPLRAAFGLIHESNMTKDVLRQPKTSQEKVQKGANYVAPDLSKLIDRDDDHA